MSISTTFVLKFSGAAVERGLARVQSAFKSLGGVAMRIGKSLVSPFAGITAAVGGLLAGGALLQAASEMNKIGEEAFASEGRLEAVTKTMGLFGAQTDSVVKRLIDLGDEQARLLGIDDDTIRLTQSKLMTFKELAKTANNIGGSFDRATMAALDMAQAGFGSAEMNAVQLGKALNDPIKGITALSRSGITFTAQEKEKIATLVKANQTLKAQDIILRAIEKQVGGAALATSTASARMTQSWGQLKEEFAKPFSTALGEIFDRIAAKIPELAQSAKAYGESVGKTLIQIADAFEQGRIGSVIQNAFMFGVTRAGEVLIASSTFAGYALYDALAEKLKTGDIGKLLTLPKAAGETPAFESMSGFVKATPYGQFVHGVETLENIARHLGKDGISIKDKSFSDLMAASKGALGSTEYQNALNQSLQKTGPHPNMKGVSYAPAGYHTNMTDEKGYRIMFDIKTGIDGLNQKLAPQP
jgi:hypothetical protein